jgi:hypothetical protein
MVRTRVQFSTILANTNKNIILIFGLNLQNTPYLVFVLCICNSNPMVGTRVQFSTILANTNKKKLFLFLDTTFLQIIFVLNINCSYGMHMEVPFCSP